MPLECLIGDTLRDLRLYGLLGSDSYRDDVWSTTWAIPDGVRRDFKLHQKPSVEALELRAYRPGYKFWIATAVTIYLAGAYFF